MEFNSLRIIYYYKFPGEESITRRLLQSLSETLTSFPVITGRLLADDKGNWTIKSNDAGVRVIQATTGVSLDEWMKVAGNGDEIRLTYWDYEHEKSYVWSPLHIQLTEFEGGGLAIGLSCTHLVADMASLTMLVKAWADTHALKERPQPPSFYPLPAKVCKKTFSKLENGMIECYKSMSKPRDTETPYPETCEPKYETLAFLFTEEQINKCMEAAQLGSASVNEPAASTAFEVLAALFWISCTKAKKKPKLVDLLLCIDMKKTMGFRSDFFGNSMVFNKVYGSDEMLRDNELRSTSRAIHGAVRKMGEVEMLDLLQYMESNRDEYGRFPKTVLQYGPDLVCINLENLEPYSAIFQKGTEPLHVSFHLLPMVGSEGQIMILPSPQGGLSRMVMVSLPLDQIKRLREDAAILGFNPTILGGMRKP
ncbi:ECERIFERUM 1 protein [Nymphaea thermarum]|nr:ECERIFERUM 1 protein [Nymphaea thermarum]